jgi:hypothetical protein
MTDRLDRILDETHELVDADDETITLQPLDEAYPDPSLASVIMRIEDHGTAPMDGHQDYEEIQRAYWELGSWLLQHNPHTRNADE